MSLPETKRPESGARLRVLVVDDSVLTRAILSKIINSAPDLEVVGTAVDGSFVMAKIERLRPDVVTLDIHMPNQDGLETLEQIRASTSVSVVMITATTTATAKSGLNALELGAFEILPKPQSIAENIPALYIDRLLNSIRAAGRGDSRAPVQRHRTAPQRPQTHGESRSPNRTHKHRPARGQTPQCIAIGSSTGGTTALNTVFQGLQGGMPPILLVQHLPAAFSAALAHRLDEAGPVHVRLAQHDMECQEGHAYLAPGDRHLTVRRQGDHLICKLDDRPAIGHHRPAVAALFDSLSDQVAAHCVAVLLTGMGRDGAEGMLQIKRRGGHTIAQDEETSVVWGMPGSAVQLDAAIEILPLSNIAQHIRLACEASATAKAS